MLCGRAVVATAVGGVSEQITADCGRVVRPRDPDALGAAILDVLGDMDVCQALSVGGEGAGREPVRDRALPRDAPRDLRASCSPAVGRSPSREGVRRLGRGSHRSGSRWSSRTHERRRLPPSSGPLARTCAQRVPQPIDVLEIAAVIESMGITDTVAAEDYGVTDGFELAGLVFDAVRAWPGDLAPVGHDPERTPERDRAECGRRRSPHVACSRSRRSASCSSGSRHSRWQAGTRARSSRSASASLRRCCSRAARSSRSDGGPRCTSASSRSDSARRFITAGLARDPARVRRDRPRRVRAGERARAHVRRGAVDLHRRARRLRAAVAARLGPEPGGRVRARLRRCSPEASPSRSARASRSARRRAIAHRLRRDRRRRWSSPGASTTRTGARPRSLPRATGPLLLDSAPYVFFGTAFAMFLVGPHLLGWLGSRRTGT